jgi:aldose 1-epimerase
MASARLTSGEVPADGLLAIADGPIEIELLPAVGARLHRLRAFGHDLLRTPADPGEHTRDPFGWGAYVMAPWCNRIAATPTEVDGQTVRVVPNFPDGTAIHGQVYDAGWNVEPDRSLSITAGDDGWPWRYRCTLRVTIADTVVTIEQSLTNLAKTTMPAGMGIHPWFRRPLELAVHADAVVASNVDPSASIETVSGAYDLRALRLVPDDLDATWLAPTDPAAELHWPELGVGAAMRVRSDAGACIVVASPASVDAVAVESQTHAAQGLRRYLAGGPGALRGIPPRGTIRLTTEFTFESSSSPHLAA